MKPAMAKLAPSGAATDYPAAKADIPQLAATTTTLASDWTIFMNLRINISGDGRNSSCPGTLSEVGLVCVKHGGEIQHAFPQNNEPTLGDQVKTYENNIFDVCCHCGCKRGSMR